MQVAEVHDATAFGELLAYEELGFCAPGHGASLVEAGATSAGGRIPVNPSGGLESRGHPLAATGVRLAVTCLKELRRADKQFGVVSACIGGGQGIAMVLEASK